MFSSEVCWRGSDNKAQGRCIVRAVAGVFRVITSVAAIPLIISCGTTGAAPAKVRIMAYINVSNGCQEPTVKYLKNYAANHRNEMALDMIDFGSEEGFARWRRDGLTCQTILVNGSSQFRVGSVGTPSSATPRIVTLKMPEGVRWTFEDLAAVLAQELKSPGSSVLSDAKAREIAQRAPVATRRSQRNGKEEGEVIVGAQTVFRFSVPLDGKSAAQRTAESASILKKLYAQRLTSTEVSAAPRMDGSAGLVVARGKTITVVSSAEAKPLQKNPVQAAQLWAFNLREALRLLGR
ncbi:MAG: hypothetical protein COZ05_07175 [Armatimonadetes bacterium CG_4_10_14_3_um_filter_59_10]|nr:MAG: hypothetical protein COZ05_07175 [Armatimonadetes bacterium CG_4_10_14_3_um_filter_59_10]